MSDQVSSNQALKTEPVGPVISTVNQSVPPQQEEMPFAVVQGKELTILPKDLYIPPDALEVILEAFEGPLDPFALSYQAPEFGYLRY